MFEKPNTILLFAGSVREGETEMSSVIPLEESSVVNYTGAADFYEQVS